MGNQLTPFEKEIKNAALEYETPYNPAAWNSLEKKLDHPSGGISTFTKLFIAAMVISVVGVGVYFSTNSDEIEVSQEELIEITVPTETNLTETEPQVEDSKELVATNTQKEAPKEMSKLTVLGETPSGEPTSEESVPEKENENEGQLNGVNPVELVETPKEKIILPSHPSSIAVSANVQSVCMGESVRCTSDYDNAQLLVWIVNGTEISKGEILEYAFNESPGMYSIFAKDKDRNIQSDVLEIEVKSVPESNFSLKKEIEEGAIPVVHGVPYAQAKYLAYRWEINSKVVSSSAELSQTLPDKGDYIVKLKVFDKNGCSSSTSQTFVNETDFNLLAPNSFSPNGDGINDTWMPKALTTGYYTFELQIFDRTNRMVYSSNNPQSSWNGNTDGSMPNAGDTFLWKATVTDSNGQSEIYGGSIVIIF
jgi:gliding motility-associated-like protein